MALCAMMFVMTAPSAIAKLMSPSRSDDIFNCIRDIVAEHGDIRTAISLAPRSVTHETYYHISNAINKFRVPGYAVDVNVSKDIWNAKRAGMTDNIMYFIHAVNSANILGALRKLPFWKYRSFLVIFGDFPDPETIIRRLVETTQFRTVNVAMVLVEEPRLNISRVVSRNPFFHETVVRHRCARIIPNYFRNLNGHRLKVSAKRLTDQRRNFGTRAEYYEGLLLKTALERLNCTVTIVEPADETVGGRAAHPTRTMFKDVAKGNTVACLNPKLSTYREFFVDDEDDLVEYTFPLVRASVVALIPTGWNQKLNLMFRFKMVTFYPRAALVLGFYLISRMLGLEHPTIPDLILLFVALLTGESLAYAKIRRLGLRFTLVLLICVCVNFMWLSLLPRELTVPEVPKTVRTIKDVTYKEDYPIRLPVVFRPLLAEMLDEETFRILNESRLNSTGIITNAELFMETRECRREAFVILDTYAEFAVTWHRYDNKNCYFILPERIMPAWKVFFFNYGSPFLGSINTVLMRMNDVGLIVYLTRGEPFESNRSAREPQFYTLGCSFLKPVFVVLLAGHLLASVVFISELALFKIR